MPVCRHLIFCLCMRGVSARFEKQEISTVSMWALQSSHDDVLREVGRQGVVTFPFSTSKFNHFYRTCARDLRATVAIRCIAPCSRKHAANRSNSRTLFRPMWRDRSRDYRKFTNTEFMIFFASYSPALKISTVSMWALQGSHHNILHEVGRHIVVCLATPDSGRAPLKFETVSALCSSDNFCARIA